MYFWKIAFAVMAALAIAANASAQSTGKASTESDARYPVKPIRLISAFAPGGGASIVARMIAPELMEAWGKPVVVDNRPGAGGAIGTEIGARARPDGYTLLMATASTIVINPLIFKVPFDPINHFTPIIHTSTVPLILVVHPSVPAKTVKELIAYGQSAGAKLNFSSSGEGTITHLAGELLKNLTKMDMVHVPYKGGGQAVIDLMAGHVQTGFMNILEGLPQVNAGRLRALAVSTTKRSLVIPNLPTMVEAGVPNYEVIQWNGVMAPAGLPKEITTKLNTEIARILARPDMRERMISSGADPGGGSAEQFGSFIKSEIAKWSELVKSVNLNQR